MTYEPINFGSCLNEWIQVKGMTASQLAAMLGYTRADALEPILRNQAPYESRRECLAALGAYGLVTREEHRILEAALNAETGGGRIWITLNYGPEHVDFEAKTIDNHLRIVLTSILS